MKNTIIAISRQYGSGGRELAHILAKKLHCKLYDRQLVHIAAAQLGIDDLNETQLKAFEDRVPPLSLKFMPFYVFGVNGSKPLNNKVYEQEAEVIRRLVKDGPCVILGRCSDYILKDNPNVCSIFVCANDEYRVRRGREVYEGKTLMELNQEDAKRAEYYNYYTGQKWGDPANYDIVVNTSHKSLEGIANSILEYMNQD